MTLHHTSDLNCPLCDEKMLEAHTYLQQWFLKVKAKYINCHISWAWRGAEDQNKFFDEGKTKLKWPDSPHNATQNGKPCSKALDLFQIDEDGLARFSPMFYAKLNAENEAAGFEIFWGGRFKSIGDHDHFEYRPKNGTSFAA